MKAWAHHYINEAGERQVTAAIEDVEKHTTGEVVVMLVKSSSTVGHIPLIIALMLCLFIGALLQTPMWPELAFAHSSLFWPILVIASYFVSFPIAKIGWVQRMLTPKLDQERQVFLRAQVEFYNARMNHTQRSTGVLILVSLMEHRAVVLADQGISSRLPSETWKEVCDLVIAGIKNKDLAQGLVEAVRLSGTHLKREFPAQAGDINELPNHLVIKE